MNYQSAFTIFMCFFVCVMLPCLIILLIIHLNSKFQQGIKWAEDNTLRSWTDEDMKDFAIYVSIRKVIPNDIILNEFNNTRVELKLIKEEIESS